ncbi:hypothetical protein BKA70DRAFT_1222815 [Coprinopsis sp. MPI-PUGE-AT-0042]|nr:hypothetical protein BKA70DRAFT_1222815 [Coprinopsis sp. MPI-PUGE-AT-0042]
MPSGKLGLFGTHTVISSVTIGLSLPSPSQRCQKANRDRGQQSKRDQPIAASSAESDTGIRGRREGCNGNRRAIESEDEPWWAIRAAIKDSAMRESQLAVEPKTRVSQNRMQANLGVLWERGKT